MPVSAISFSVPALQLLLVAPQTPSTLKGALQDAFVPPLAPLHDQVHGPDPDTAVAVPAPHKPEDGAEVTPTPFAAPHDPLVGGLQVCVIEIIAEFP